MPRVATGTGRERGSAEDQAVADPPTPSGDSGTTPDGGCAEDPAALLDPRLVGQLAEAAAARLSTGTVKLLGSGGLLQALAKQVLERTLELELQAHLHPPTPTANGRNGARTRQVLTEVGPVPVRVPRDRDGTFAPRAVRPRARRLPGLDELVVSLTARGLSSAELTAHLAEVYGVEISRETVSAVTDQAFERLTEHHSRPLAPVHPVVFLHTVRPGRTAGPQVHLALGITPDGRRDLLGLWPGGPGRADGAHIPAALAARGLREAWVVVADTGPVAGAGAGPAAALGPAAGAGLAEAVARHWPGAALLGSTARLIREVLRHAPGEEWSALSQDLREVCTAPTETAALDRLGRAERRWGPARREVFLAWRAAWPQLAPGFRFEVPVRRLLAGGGALERLQQRLRRLEQSAGRPQDERAALKRAYLATLALDAPGEEQEWCADWPAVRRALASHH
ncbi:hypothetical protein CFP65_5437 [Kitasatospora sp. MMS16-BH015]|uniref:transposase n=1 Tax=Kitasatospora sp. MMS16-BH015 TaxID=2018025 RepID=UPI000CA38D09|nr:transposase [Kitasatospora sp. MMS16-BH015]AUG80139.1 hypothetical protein CFP65_5437 [Kitasatospora sp. MMS16-BH015]